MPFSCIQRKMVNKYCIFPPTWNELGFKLKYSFPSFKVYIKTNKNPGTKQSISHYNHLGNYLLSWGLQAQSEIHSIMLSIFFFFFSCNVQKYINCPHKILIGKQTFTFHFLSPSPHSIISFCIFLWSAEIFLALVDQIHREVRKTIPCLYIELFSSSSLSLLL